MGVLNRIRRALFSQRYEVTQHAKEELEDDGLTLDDLKTAILGGTITRKLTHDVRGTRYEVTGPTLGGGGMRIVGRFLGSGEYRIITVFRIK